MSLAESIKSQNPYGWRRPPRPFEINTVTSPSFIDHWQYLLQCLCTGITGLFLIFLWKAALPRRVCNSSDTFNPSEMLLLSPWCSCPAGALFPPHAVLQGAPHMCARLQGLGTAGKPLWRSEEWGERRELWWLSSQPPAAWHQAHFPARWRPGWECQAGLWFCLAIISHLLGTRSTLLLRSQELSWHRHSLKRLWSCSPLRLGVSVVFL